MITIEGKNLRRQENDNSNIILHNRRILCTHAYSTSMATKPKVSDEQLERARQHLIYDDAIARAKRLFQVPPHKKKTKRFKNLK